MPRRRPADERDPRRRVPPQDPASPRRPRRTDEPLGRRSSGEIHTRSKPAERQRAAAPQDPARKRRPRPDAEQAPAKKSAAKKADPTKAAGPRKAASPKAGAPKTAPPKATAGEGPVKTGAPKKGAPKSGTQETGTPARAAAGARTPKKRRPAATAGATAVTEKLSVSEGSTAATTPSTAPPGTSSRRRAHWASGAGWGRALIAIASVAVLLCTGYAWNTMSDLETRITQLGGLGLGGAKDGAVDILLVGTDSRTDAKGNPLSPEEIKLLRSGEEVATNTDTILLVRIPEDGSSATAISIPRDSYVDVPGIGMSKINAAYGTTREGVRARAVEAGQSPEEAEKEGTLAGRKALVDTVANLTGVQVDHYAEVGLLGFVLLTNAVGGIDVCLNAPVRDPFSGARFRKGVQTLNGPRALSFVRQRHGLPRGDLDRITRQQAFMASLTQKVLSAGTLTDPGKLSEMQNAVARSIVIDDGWNIISFAEQLKDLSGGRVKFATIPIVTEQGWSEDGLQSVVEVDPQAVKTYTSDLLTPKQAGGDTQRGDFKVDVVNAGTIDGLGSNVANILTNKGYQSGETSSGKADTRDSVVYAKENGDAARLLAKDLGGVKVVEDPNLADDQLKVILTNTYAGPGGLGDTGDQTDNTPASERVGNKRPPITAGTKGPMCVN
ncbi:LCP family protein [Gordonia rubripertincta]|uniref:LCP family protein n=2 Tax=Gordonia rubripertincta TaxID=36822 RepID=A0AAW6R6B7_GORRU|nr:LCP family protein [Gordonia rubripertincta]MDG6780086.1 LCP family protein [Gordonia rubripertincta]NKY65220.1 LytR family transcriptional regulator [Gordonia rubripertincta]TSD96759.1 LytR family transcriptional regulator [Gordonia rubripertincta]GAB83312.1 putative LytR family regulatory protein [Gordonia rubripertincta NBRC 101908]